MFFLKNSGQVVLAYDLGTYLVITGYAPKENGSFTCAGKRPFTKPMEALENYSKAVSCVSNGAGKEPERA